MAVHRRRLPASLHGRLRRGWTEFARMNRWSPKTRRWVSYPYWVYGGAVLALLTGCRSVPSEKFENCRRLNDTLRTENARLRDQTVALGSQNQDLSERAVDDARRLRSQEEAIARLERSVHAYQAERDELEVAFKQLKQTVSDIAPRTSTRHRASVDTQPEFTDGGQPGATGERRSP